MNQQDKAKIFKELHKEGDPVILFNAWDPGSAAAVASQGASAIALGSHGVANAHGFEDGQLIPLELVLSNAERTVDAVDVPVTLDFETGYGETPEAVGESVVRALKTGIIGVNIEDQMSGGDRLYSRDEQAARLRAVRTAADSQNVDLFINARSDVFKNADPADHNDTLLDEALLRAQAFADAGADGFFLPGVTDLGLIKRLCAESPLPVNIIMISGAAMPTTKQLAEAGVARISYGPFPYLDMIEWLKRQAQAAFEAR